MQLCIALDLPTKEENLSLVEKIKEYDELFITSTLFNVLPIKQLNEIEFSSSFEKTKLIEKLFKEYYNKKVFISI